MSSRVRKATFERDGYACLNCEGTENLTVDHIDPAGPVNSTSNTQTLCWECNKGKGKFVRDLRKSPYEPLKPEVVPKA